MQITTFHKPVLRRSMKKFDLENFLRDLQRQLKTLTVANLNISVSSDSDNLTNFFQNVLNRHAPRLRLSKAFK